MRGDGPRRSPAIGRRFLRLLARAATALPAWLVAVAIAPYVAPGGSSDPWNPTMPYARAMWFGAHQLIAFQQIYLVVEPGGGMVYPLSSVGAALGSVMAFGSWFGWQLIFLALAAGSLSWLLARCTGLAGWRLAAAAALCAALCAPVRVAVGQGTLDLMMAVLLVAGLWPRRPGRELPSSIGLGAASAIWLGPVAGLVTLWAGYRRSGRVPGLLGRRGVVGSAAALVLTLCTLLVLPWDTNDFWWRARRGDTGVVVALDPSLGGRAGLLGWVLAGLLGLAGVLVAGESLRRARPRMAVVLVCLVMSVCVPAQWSGQGVLALVSGLLVLRMTGDRLMRIAVLVWAGWTCLVPLDLLGSRWHAAGLSRELLVWAGPVLGLSALAVAVCSGRPRRSGSDTKNLTL